MPATPYYREALARIHHLGFAFHPENVAPAIVALLQPVLGGTVLEIGCGSGLLTRHLLDAGHTVIATDASPDMLALAAELVPEADRRRLTLPDDPLPAADAIVGSGHALNYLDDATAIGRALFALTQALRPGGLLVIDLEDELWGATRRNQPPFTQVTDEYVIVTRFSVPAPDLFVRDITAFMPAGDGHWRRDDERHENVLVDVALATAMLRQLGLDAEVRVERFGPEQEQAFPVGLYGVVARKAPTSGPGAAAAGSAGR